MTIIVAIVGMSIIAVLAAIALKLQLQVRALEQRKQQALEEKALEQEQQRARINKSIQVLAQGIVEKQLTMTEGAIRISVLLDSLAVDSATRERFSVFFQLAQATSHIPILERWAQLSSSEKRRFDSERSTIEGQYGDFIVDAAKRIQGEVF